MQKKDNIAASFAGQFEKLSLPLHGVRCPKIDVDKKFLSSIGIDSYQDNHDLLKKLCNASFKSHLPKWKELGYDIDKYKERVRYEVETLNKLGFVDYILIVWDVFNFCRSKGIPFGLGRGCFVPESKVLMADGSTKEISKIEVGESVISHDSSVQEVQNTLTYDVDEELIELTFEDGRTVTCTKDHEIFTQRGWVAANELLETDDVIEVNIK